MTKLRCGFCKACTHMYNCSCVDSAVHSTVCKHVHIVHMSESIASTSTSDSVAHSECSQLSSTQQNLQSPFIDANCCNDNVTELELPHQPLSVSNSSVAKLKQDMTMHINEVQAIVDSTSDCAVLKAGASHITSAIAVMKAMMNCSTSQTLVARKRVAPNENSEIQRRFTSTKKKRTISQICLSKPTVCEMEDVSTLLYSVNTRVCSICFKEDDEQIRTNTEHHNTDTSWIQCSTCSSWLHCTCCGISTSLEDTHSGDYMCKYCT